MRIRATLNRSTYFYGHLLAGKSAKENQAESPMSKQHKSTFITVHSLHSEFASAVLVIQALSIIRSSKTGPSHLQPSTKRPQQKTQRTSSSPVCS